MFFRTTALSDPAMKGVFDDVLRACGYPVMPIHVWALGEKSSRANAMLAGMGATRRVLVADTLLSGYSLPEIRMVLAHELGHHRLGHVWRSLVLSAAVCALGFAALFGYFGPLTLSARPLLPSLALLAYLTQWLAAPFLNAVSREHEREADRYALRQYPVREVFVSLMERLSRQNMADPSPSFLEVLFLHTHPPKTKRIEAGLIFLEKNGRTH
jgi:STE24 endopeptidase